RKVDRLMTLQEAIAHVDNYRAYSKALRLMSDTKPDDLHKKSRIVHYLYEQGNYEWLMLVGLECAIFGRAFDLSRAKGLKEIL
ncbi:MAG TPA: hypothetical protein VMQ76_04030, partial [Terracidiphilus sp.]|nr:hypothetical protein [Terracidiphilus sp.]